MRFTNHARSASEMVAAIAAAAGIDAGNVQVSCSSEGYTASIGVSLTLEQKQAIRAAMRGKKETEDEA